MAVQNIGGCIRFYGTGPQWHLNASHVTVGFDTATPPRILDTGDLEVRVNTGEAIVGIIAGADETLTERGITAGPSGGIGPTKIRFHHKDHGRLYLNRPEHYALVSGESITGQRSLANVWLLGLVVAPDPEPSPRPICPCVAPPTVDEISALRRSDLVLLNAIGNMLRGGTCCTHNEHQPPAEETTS